MDENKEGVVWSVLRWILEENAGIAQSVRSPIFHPIIKGSISKFSPPRIGDKRNLY